MSRVIAAETLKAIPEDALLESHLRLVPPLGLTLPGGRFHREAPLLNEFGIDLMERAYEAGWDGERDEYPLAICSGSERLFVPTLRWLKPKTPTPAEIVTRKWLTSMALSSQIQPEVTGLMEDNHSTDEVAYAAEDEVAEYPAFVALARGVEADLREKAEIDIQVGAVVRLGVALAALAIKRTLEPTTKFESVPEATTQAGGAQEEGDGQIDFEAWFKL